MRSPSLFWRTLLLVLLLIVASLAAWLQSYRVFERAPRAQSVAQQVVSVVNITRAALLYSDPFDRKDLLRELATNQGIRIYPLEPSDKVEPLPDGPLIKMDAKSIIEKLGAGTRLAAAVNGIRGLWVSLAIEEDKHGGFRSPGLRCGACCSGDRSAIQSHGTSGSSRTGLPGCSCCSVPRRIGS